jgi:hypothetical protein
MFLDGIKGVAGDIGADIGRKKGEESLGGLGGYVGAGEVGASAGRSTAESLVDSVAAMVGVGGEAGDGSVSEIVKAAVSAVPSSEGMMGNMMSMLDPLGIAKKAVDTTSSVGTGVMQAAPAVSGMLDPLGIASQAAGIGGGVVSGITSALGFGGSTKEEDVASKTEASATSPLQSFLSDLGPLGNLLASIGGQESESSQYQPEGTFDNGGYSAGSPFKAADSASMSSLFSGGSMSSQGAATSQAIDLTPVTSLLTSIDAHLANMNKIFTQRFNNEKTEASEQGSGVPIDSLTSIFDQFTSDFSDVVSRLENVAMTVQVQPVEVNINLNGGGILQAVKENVSSQILEEVKKEIQTFKVGDGGRLVKGTSTLPK